MQRIKVFFHMVHYRNLHFTHLLTYLQTLRIMGIKKS